MKAIRFLSWTALATAAALSAAQAQSVSVNATITGEVLPGVYGQVVLGNGPPPPVLYAQPTIVEPAPVVVSASQPGPIYLHVPPGHAKNWRRHCHEYHACDRPVYFVKSAEYEAGYRPDHRHEDHGHHDDRDRGDHDHGHRHDD